MTRVHSRPALFLLGVIVVTALAAGIAAGKEGAASLDGRTYEVTLLKPDGSKEGDDFLVFNDGQFLSTACRPYGFGKGSYTASMKDGGTLFTATTKSAAEGTMKWIGTVNGRAIEGSTEWTNKEGQLTRLTWSGSMLP